MINLGAPAAGDTTRRQRSTHAARKAYEGSAIFKLQARLRLQVEGVDEKEPVAAPGNISDNATIFSDRYLHGRAMPIAWHIGDRYFTVWVQLCRDHPHRRLDSVRSRVQSPEISKRGHEADGPVTAHAEVSHVVEKDDSSGTRWIERPTKKRPDQCIGAARLIHHRRSKSVVLLTEDRKPLGHRAPTEIRSALQYQPGGFSGRMGIHYADR